LVSCPELIEMLRFREREKERPALEFRAGGCVSEFHGGMGLRVCSRRRSEARSAAERSNS
jgi:hypothetical protein